jgi:predicted nucleotidyltransferase component of viral defense system
MLRKETVSESTLDLLIKLMREDFLKKFFLVGGTALALQIGHRISIDIDLFSKYEKKYATRNPTMAIKALGYHHDIDFNEPIILLDGKYKLEGNKEITR